VAILVAIVLLLLPLLGLWLFAEDKRKAGKTGRAGPGQGSGLMRAGLLEMQNLLEPDRKVEILREEERKRDLLVDLDERGRTPREGGGSLP
jgi:hypothetical protein